MVTTGFFEKNRIMGDLTVKEAAERLGLNEFSVNRYIVQGLFPGAYKQNPFAPRRSPWRIPEDAIVAFEQKRRDTAIKPK